MNSKTILNLEPIKDGDKIIGVNIPLINKSLLFADISEEKMEWEKAVKHAEDMGKELPDKSESYILQYFREQIAEYWPKFKDLDIWSKTQASADFAWSVYGYGFVYYYPKCFFFSAVPLADLMTSNS